MEFQFQNKPLRSMRQVAWETKNEEQTLEIRITEDMPPVDKILAAWGQPVIRSKDWNGDQAVVSGGVMAWVLYDAQNGAGPQKVEGWIPFQFKWDLKDSDRDGVFQTQWLLRSIDARLTGAGKLMVRASVSALGEGLEETNYDFYVPGELPKDVQVLKERIDICIPAEAGEKVMQLDEEMVLPPGRGEIDQVLAYQLRPVVTEKKLMSDKFVFRGTAKLQAVYLCTDGRIHSYETDIPISQYTQLEQEYSPEAWLRLIPEVSELELEKTDPTRLRLKGAVVGQYSVWEKQKVEAVTDAYSNRRHVEMQITCVSFPALIADETIEQTVCCHVPASVTDAVAYNMWMGQPIVKGGEMEPSAYLEGSGQVLYYEDGNLCAESKMWDDGVALSGKNRLQPVMYIQGYPVLKADADGIGLSQDISILAADICDTELKVVSGVTLGDLQKPDPSRPSLVLCSAGDKSLWQLAKECGSTVDLICKANDLEEKPEPNKILVIPVE